VFTEKLYAGGMWEKADVSICVRRKWNLTVEVARRSQLQRGIRFGSGSWTGTKCVCCGKLGHYKHNFN
jgi:hypothetical protein